MPRTYGWRSWRDVVAEGLLGAAVGDVVLIIEGGARDQFPDWQGFARNAILGAFVILVPRLFETMLSRAIEQSRIPTTLRTVVYALGGGCGYIVGILIRRAIFPVDRRDFETGGFHFRYAIVMTALVAIVVGLILHHNRKRNDRLRQTIERLKEHEFAEKELEIARSMQRRLLPPPELTVGSVRVSARNQPAHIVAGDFYDVLRLPDGSAAVIVADVSGKGIAASLIMASCKAAIPFLATSRDPVAVMQALNEKLCDELERREFVAMVYAHFDAAGGRAEVVNAGMPDPLVLTSNGTRAIECPGERLPLGLRREIRYSPITIDFSDGERMLLFSDGLAEASVDGEPLGYERIETLASRSASVDDLLASIQSIPNVRIEDDVTAVFISRTVSDASLS